MLVRIPTYKKRWVVGLPGFVCKIYPPMWFLEFAVSLPSNLPNKGGSAVYLPTLSNINHPKNVGRYSHPMDPMGFSTVFRGFPGFILRPDEDKGRGSKGRKGLRSSAATTNSESWASKATTSSEWSTKAEGQWNSQWVPKESKDTPLECWAGRGWEVTWIGRTFWRLRVTHDGSMGLVYLPTFTIKINHSCR